MTLAEFMEKPLKEALQELSLVDSKVHTNDAGQVIAVELKYKDPSYKEKLIASPRLN